MERTERLPTAPLALSFFIVLVFETERCSLKLSNLERSTFWNGTILNENIAFPCEWGLKSLVAMKIWLHRLILQSSSFLHLQFIWLFACNNVINSWFVESSAYTAHLR